MATTADVVAKAIRDVNKVSMTLRHIVNETKERAAADRDAKVAWRAGERLRQEKASELGRLEQRVAIEEQLAGQPKKQTEILITTARAAATMPPPASETRVIHHLRAGLQDKLSAQVLERAAARKRHRQALEGRLEERRELQARLDELEETSKIKKAVSTKLAVRIATLQETAKTLQEDIKTVKERKILLQEDIKELIGGQALVWIEWELRMKHVLLSVTAYQFLFGCFCFCFCCYLSYSHYHRY